MSMLGDAEPDAFGELQLFAFLHGPKAATLLATCMWTPAGFCSNVTLFQHAPLLIDPKPPRALRNYQYAVLRRPIPQGVRHTYLLPPDTITTMDVDSMEGRADLFHDVETSYLPQLAEFERKRT